MTLVLLGIGVDYQVGVIYRLGVGTRGKREGREGGKRGREEREGREGGEIGRGEREGREGGE